MQDIILSKIKIYLGLKDGYVFQFCLDFQLVESLKENLIETKGKDLRR